MVHVRSIVLLNGAAMLTVRLLAALALVAVFAIGWSADAQELAQKADKQTTAQKKPPPRLEPEHISWYKMCQEVPDRKDPKQKITSCATSFESYQPVTGQLLMLAQVNTFKKSNDSNLMITLPLLMFIPAGAQIKIDDDEPLPLRYVFCAPHGCIAQLAKPKDTNDVVKKLQSGKKLSVVSSLFDGRPWGVKIPLTGFTKSFRGKAINKKKLADRRNAVKKNIETRQKEWRERMTEAQKNQKEKKQ